MPTDPQERVFALLFDPATHGGETVDRIDTHAASVFLAGSRAYKVKRAVFHSGEIPLGRAGLPTSDRAGSGIACGGNHAGRARRPPKASPESSSGRLGPHARRPA
jgi:hypothetical protein